MGEMERGWNCAGTALEVRAGTHCRRSVAATALQSASLMNGGTLP